MPEPAFPHQTSSTGNRRGRFLSGNLLFPLQSSHVTRPSPLPPLCKEKTLLRVWEILGNICPLLLMSWWKRFHSFQAPSPPVPCTTRTRQLGLSCHEQQTEGLLIWNLKYLILGQNLLRNISPAYSLTGVSWSCFLLKGFFFDSWMSSFEKNWQHVYKSSCADVENLNLILIKNFHNFCFYRIYC